MHFCGSRQRIPATGYDLDRTSTPFPALAESEPDLLVRLSPKQREALYRAARLYEDALGLIQPPIHSAAEINDARRWLGKRAKQWHMETAVRFCRWATVEPANVCAAYVCSELDVDISYDNVRAFPVDEDRTK
jgi:hypothetical protein